MHLHLIKFVTFSFFSLVLFVATELFLVSKDINLFPDTKLHAN